MAAIEWTDRSDWNPIRGCTRVSEGCRACYAESIAARFSGPGQPFEGYAKKVGGEARWTGKVGLIEDRLTLPLKWREPSKIFVNSASDLFHESVPDAWIDKVFAVMALAPQHTFQVLTKRSNRMREYCNGKFTARRIATAILDLFIGAKINGVIRNENYPMRDECSPDEPTLKSWPLPNVWLGVSAEDQQRADERIPDLLATPAAIRFVSAEPLLGPLDLKLLQYDDAAERDGRGMVLATRRKGLDWIIVGGESGPGARPMHPQWARSIRDQCQAAGVAFFFKQFGEWAPYEPQPGGDLGDHIRRGSVTIVHPSGRDAVAVAETTGGRSTEPGSRYMKRLGKSRAGRLLDGREHNDMPSTPQQSGEPQ